MTAKILVTDDEIDIQDLITQKFEFEIEEGEYEFIFANNGVEALETVQLHSDLDLVLTDINMPVMGGIELLTHLKTSNPLLKTIVMSAYGDMDNIRQAMNAGAFDFLTKPISFRDLEVTIDRTLGEVKLLKENHGKLQQAQVQLVQSEKMSALGQLVAGVAHEINNPVNFIYGNLNFAANYAQDLLELLQLFLEHTPNPAPEIQEQLDNLDFEFLKEDLPKLFNSMKLGADRIRNIVLSLRNFSRVDKVQEEIVDLHAGIDDTLMILHNRLKAQPDRPEIQIVKHYGNLPKVKCYSGQLNQVFMNILSNAIDAIEEVVSQHKKTASGEIRIITDCQDNWITIRIVDNGPGIPEAACSQLFNPFFTTKPVGKGTGLGLSISYQIVVEKHSGNLYCNSVLDQGTEFVIKIPLQALDSAITPDMPQSHELEQQEISESSRELIAC